MKPLNVLVGYEYSAVVRDEFRKLGHNAWSCDILPTEGDPDYHYEMDIFRCLKLTKGIWDLVIFHPPCTYVCSSGLHWNKRVPGRAEKTEAALEDVRKLFDCGVPKIVLENPVGCISTRIRPYAQAIQPWMFGEDASKKTCLWTVGIEKKLDHTGPIIPPKGYKLVKFAADMPQCECVGPTMDDWHYRTIEGYLFATNIVDKDGKPLHPVWANQTPSGQNKLGPSETRGLDRAKTYLGIGRALASQLGGQVTA